MKKTFPAATLIISEKLPEMLGNLLLPRSFEADRRSSFPENAARKLVDGLRLEGWEISIAPEVEIRFSLDMLAVLARNATLRKLDLSK